MRCVSMLVNLGEGAVGELWFGRWGWVRSAGGAPRGTAPSGCLAGAPKGFCLEDTQLVLVCVLPSRPRPFTWRASSNHVNDHISCSSGLVNDIKGECTPEEDDSYIYIRWLSCSNLSSAPIVVHPWPPLSWAANSPSHPFPRLNTVSPINYSTRPVVLSKADGIRTKGATS